jgi:solute carrier family 35 (UDP-sugar transporter), member A1/2/3
MHSEAVQLVLSAADCVTASGVRQQCKVLHFESFRDRMFRGPVVAGLLAAALSLTTLAPVMVKFTQNTQGGYDYNKWSVYFFAELIKFLVASWWSLHLRATDHADAEQMVLVYKELIRYSGPAFFFFAQNNLSFIALKYLSSSSFQLFLNCRIIMVALFSMALLKKNLNQVEWIAIILLFTGAVQYNLASCSETDLRFHPTGLLVVCIIACCAASGNVYTQLCMQRRMQQPLMFQNAQLYAFGIIYNGLNWGMSVVGVTGNEPVFGELGWRPVLAMVFYAVYGLTISFILKRFGALVRTFINAVAIVCNAAIDSVFFNSQVTVSDVTCFVVILSATVLYANLAQDYKPPQLDRMPQAVVQRRRMWSRHKKMAITSVLTIGGILVLLHMQT